MLKDNTYRCDQIWGNFNCNIWKLYLKFGKTLNLPRQFLNGQWAHFHCCKWPNLEKWSRHLVTLIPTPLEYGLMLKNSILSTICRLITTSWLMYDFMFKRDLLHILFMLKYNIMPEFSNNTIKISLEFVRKVVVMIVNFPVKLSATEWSLTNIARGAAMAQWIRLRLPSCRPGFESQAHHLHFYQFIELCNVEKTKIRQKEAGIGPFKKTKYSSVDSSVPSILPLLCSPVRIPSGPCMLFHKLIQTIICHRFVKLTKNWK